MPSDSQPPSDPALASVSGSAYDRNTARIREECERRLGIVKNGVESAIFALDHMNPRLATEYLDDVTRYGALAKLDTEELTRRLKYAEQ